MYTDPSGEWIHLVIGAISGGTMNWMANGAEFTWKGLGYFGIGAAAGALGAGIGAGVGSAIAGTGFGAGFIGTSTATVTGFLGSAAVAGSSVAASSLITGAGNSWMQGNSFGKGLWDGTKASLINGTIAAVTGGIMGGIDAAISGRNFWTGNYKQYDLPLNYIASTDNSMMFDQYAFPKNATVANEDIYNVYYKPEDGVYGINNVVKPGKYITNPVDGVATSKYTDMVYKIPDGGKVKVLLGGDVRLTNPFTTQIKASANDLYKCLRYGETYKFAWMSLNELDSSWEMLFKLSLIIK
jgi:hypothetical protein